MTSVNYTCSCPSGFTGMLCGTNTQGTSRAGLPPARSWLGTEPHTHRIWPTSFRLVVTLLTEHTYVRTYASTDCTGGVGDTNKRREGFLRCVLANPHPLYLTFKIWSIDSCQNRIATDRSHVSTHMRSISETTHRGDVIYLEAVRSPVNCFNTS